MKKIMTAILMFVVCFSLCSCADIGTTKEYRNCKKVYTSFVKGKEYTKQDLYDKLGQPQYPDLDYYSAEMGLTLDEMLFDAGTKEWRYFFYQLTDPANPYDLVIEFDTDGKAIHMEFDVVPGG